MLRNRCRRRLLLLLITDSIYGIVVEDVDLKRLAVFFKRDTKLILPLRREYRSPARLGLGAFFDDPLINLCGSKIEHKEILAVRTDEFSKNLISIAWIPAHHVKQLHEEYLSGHLTRLIRRTLFSYLDASLPPELKDDVQLTDDLEEAISPMCRELNHQIGYDPEVRLGTITSNKIVWHREETAEAGFKKTDELVVIDEYGKAQPLKEFLYSIGVKYNLT